MKIHITIGGKLIEASVLDNDAAREFISMLPLQLVMKDLFEREKYCTLPKALAAKEPRTYKYDVGDIAYWSPSRDLAIYYKQDGEKIPSPGIIPLAKIDAYADAFNLPGDVKVIIELAS